MPKSGPPPPLPPSEYSLMRTGQGDMQPGPGSALEHQAGARLPVHARRHPQAALRDAGLVDGVESGARKIGGVAGAVSESIDPRDALGSGPGIPVARMQGA